MKTTTTQTTRSWTDTLRVQAISLVILLGSAAAFGLAHPAPAAAHAAPVGDRPVHVLAVADGASCGLDPEPSAPVAPVSTARRVFGAARCTE